MTAPSHPAKPADKVGELANQRVLSAPNRSRLCIILLRAAGCDKESQAIIDLQLLFAHVSQAQFSAIGTSHSNDISGGPRCWQFPL